MAADLPDGATGIWQCELPSERLFWSPAVKQLFGLAPEADLHRPAIVDMYEGGCRDRMQAIRAYGIRSGKGFSLDASIWTGDGTKRWIHIDGKIMTSGAGPRRLVGTKRDVTRLYQLWAEARSISSHDPVTGLPGPLLFGEHHAALVGLDPAGGISCLKIELSNFLNLGRESGLGAAEECMLISAIRMRHFLQSSGTPYALQSGVFGVLMQPKCASLLAALATRLKAALQDPIYWRGRLLFPEVSVTQTIAPP